MYRSIAAVILLLGSCAACGQEAPAKMIPPPIQGDSPASGSSEKAVLAGGCYWGTQGIFEHVRGIKRVVAGFAAGHSDEDGGAESVMITFDPRVLSYGRLLQIFFSVVHDPTELNRQGPDVGPGYRSDIFYMNADQQRIAQAYVAQLDRARVFAKPLVTRVDEFSSFNAVDLSQQDFMLKNPHLEYIEVNDLPKLASLKQLFPTFFRSSPLEYHP
ncbi:MAG TPA: peptide-methionine (S)-S-oxide reductase [Steroidobacteraceae bacterium]|nr:peptide-methionine (S)-S-oxide reductase [Steroidobacteraceae bacterium]